MTDVARILAGPLVWLAAFSAVYGLHGIACSFGWSGIEFWGLSLMRLVLVLAWFVAILLLVLVLAALYSRRLGSHSAFIRGVSMTTGWVGLVATLWSLFPVVATSTCQ